jgi:hypothetical protein
LVVVMMMGCAEGCVDVASIDATINRGTVWHVG